MSSAIATNLDYRPAGKHLRCENPGGWTGFSRCLKCPSCQVMGLHLVQRERKPLVIQVKAEPLVSDLLMPGEELTRGQFLDEAGQVRSIYETSGRVVRAEPDEEWGVMSPAEAAAHHARVAARAAEDQRLIQQFTDVLAAHGVFPPQRESTDAGENAPDQHFCRLLASPEAMRSKFLAEADRAPESVDWKDAPEGAWDAYSYMHVLAQAGERIQVDLSDQVRAFLTRTRVNGAQLIELDGEEIRLLTDPVEERTTREQYPGCPEGVNPRAGYSLAARGDDALVAAWAMLDGLRVSVEPMLRLINSGKFRELHGLVSCRYASRDWYKKAMARVRAAGLLVKKEPERHYRKMHVWRTIPAAFGPPSAPEKRTDEERLDSFRQLAVRLRSRPQKQ